MAKGNLVSLVDVAKRVDQNGVYAEIAEVLNQSNPIIQDMPFHEANAPRGNRVTYRTGLPQVHWARLNKGISASKSNVTSREDTIGWLEGRSEVDRRHAGRSMTHENYLKYRWDEDQTFLESMSQEMAKTILFGNEEYQAEAFTGFFPRLSNPNDPIFGKSLTLAVTGVAQGNASDKFDNLLIVDWGKRYCHGIYPFNTPAGLKKTDHPNEPVKDDAGGTYYADVSQFEWCMGLTVKHPKHVHRIANVPVAPFDDIVSSGAYTLSPKETAMSELFDTTTTPPKVKSLPDLPGMLIRAFNSMDPCTSGHRVIYTSQRILTALDLLAQNKNNVQLSYGEWAGQPVTMFRGVPIRKLDILDNVDDYGIAG